MSAKVQAPGERKTRRAIAKLLKTEGPIDSAQLAERLGLTTMAVRQHLYALQREGLVTAEERPVPIGRPAKFWRLTREADHLFPEAYAELSVALIDSVKDAFGDEGLERVLTSRCARQRVDYGKRIKPGDSLEKKLAALAKVRSELRPRGIVKSSRLSTTSKGHRNAFHELINVNVPSVARAGPINGRIMRT